MVNWKQRELERARNAVMLKERLLRELKEQADVEHDDRETHDAPDQHAAKRRKLR